MKTEVRQRMLRRCRTLTHEERVARSEAVLRRLQTLPVFRSATAIGIYSPLPGEVLLPTPLPGPERALFLPAFDPLQGCYRLAALCGDLRSGRFGIPEPLHPRFAHPDEPDLILVPGIAFDPSTGIRLGRGGGWYDRLLPLYQAPRVGLCFDFQIEPNLPCNAQDARVDQIVSETKIFSF